MDKKLLGMPVLVLCLLVCFIVLCNPFVMVGPGERGIKVTLGHVQAESYGEGLHTIFPFIQKFRTMDVKTQRNTLTTAVYTKDIQQAKITYVLNLDYCIGSVSHFDPEKSPPKPVLIDCSSILPLSLFGLVTSDEAPQKALSTSILERNVLGDK